MENYRFQVQVRMPAGDWWTVRSYQNEEKAIAALRDLRQSFPRSRYQLIDSQEGVVIDVEPGSVTQQKPPINGYYSEHA